MNLKRFQRDCLRERDGATKKHAAALNDGAVRLDAGKRGQDSSAYPSTYPVATPSYAFVAGSKDLRACTVRQVPVNRSSMSTPQGGIVDDLAADAQQIPVFIRRHPAAGG